MTTRRRHLERATALVLVPAMMLVVIALGSIAIDLSVMHLATRSANTIVAVAADDAAGMLDDDALQMNGDIRVDPLDSRRVALAHIRSARLPGSLEGDPEFVIDSDGRGVQITIRLQVEHIFLKSFPGARAQTIQVSAAARLTG